MKKKLAIWGTGNVCAQVMGSCPWLVPVKLIDNNLEKSGMFLQGIEIIHPSKIMDWQDLFVVLAMDNYIGVKRQLEEKGLVEKENFVWYREWQDECEIESILEEAEDFLCKIEDYEKEFHGYRIMFSDFLAFDKGVCGYVNKWSEDAGKLMLLSEAMWVSPERKSSLHVPIMKLPKVLLHNFYLRSGDIRKEITAENIKDARPKPYMEEAKENLKMGYPDMAANYECVICYYADEIVRKILSCWKPSQVILWNAFYGFHMIVRSVCLEEGIPIKYMEFGNIPGTIIVEELGQMGESWPARYPQEFMEIPVSGKEYEDAELLVQELQKSRLNRNEQPRNNVLSAIKSKLKKGRPIVFFAGQNDNASGMQPYTENTWKFHSPIFKSSDEAAVFLAEVCERNEWNYIYKPHPMMTGTCDNAIIPASTIFVEDADIHDLIDLSDVVVTILSTVSYSALIRKKPVVMLGYTQLKGKGCTFEAFEKEYIEKEISAGLVNNTDEHMYQSFIKHVAQLNRYYAIGR
jgi:Capsule polysaccharide export protein